VMMYVLCTALARAWTRQAHTQAGKLDGHCSAGMLTFEACSCTFITWRKPCYDNSA